MGDAAIYHEELNGLEQQLHQDLDEILVHGPSMTGAARATHLSKLQDGVRRLHRLLQQLRVETRLLDGNEKEVYESKAAAHTQAIASLKERLQETRGKVMLMAASSNTMGGPSPALDSQQHQDYQQQKQYSKDNSESPIKRGGGVTTTPAAAAVAATPWTPTEAPEREESAAMPQTTRLAAQQTATRIQEVQGSTLQSLGRSEKLLNETEVLGNEAATTLRIQTEQIQRVNEELDEMHDDIGRAGKELKAFMRRMARDRLVIFFAIAIVVCIIIIVVLAVLKHHL